MFQRDQDGTLTLGEFNKAVKYMRRRFPLTERHLTKLENLFEKYDTDQSGTLDINEMRAMLKDIDSKMTHLPAVSKQIHSNSKISHLSLDGASGKPARTVPWQVFEPDCWS